MICALMESAPVLLWSHRSHACSNECSSPPTSIICRNEHISFSLLQTPLLLLSRRNPELKERDRQARPSTKQFSFTISVNNAQSLKKPPRVCSFFVTYEKRRRTGSLEHTVLLQASRQRCVRRSFLEYNQENIHATLDCPGKPQE